MIRAFDDQDLVSVTGLIRSGTRMQPETIRELVTTRKTWVYADCGSIRGVACTTEFDDAYGLRIFVGPQWRRKGIGSALYEHVRPCYNSPGPDKVNTYYRVDTGDEARRFFAKRGFRPWYGMTELSYQGPRQPQPDVDIRPYEYGLFGTYIRILGRSFAQMRADHGFEPHDVEEMHNTEQTRAEFAQRASDLFIAFTGEGTPIGCADLQGDYIDTVGVLPEYQGRGFGKALTRHCINLLLDRGFAIPRTSVVTDNHRAHNLYLKLGFRQTEAYETATLKVK